LAPVNILTLNRAIGAKLLFLDALPPPAKASGRKSCPTSAFLSPKIFQDIDNFLANCPLYS